MSDNEKTPVENEATDVDSVTFEHFGRTWTVPAVVRLSHMRQLRRDPGNVGIVDAFLDEDQLAELDKIDPTGDDLDKFTDDIVKAMGLKSAGN